MQEIRPISQKFTEILQFENSDITKFCVPWPTEIAAARSIFEIQRSSFGFSPLFVGSKNDVLQPRLYERFLKIKFV